MFSEILILPASNVPKTVAASTAQAIISGPSQTVAGVAVTFNGLGRILAANLDGGKLITDIQFTTTMVSDPRILHVVVGNDKSATGIRICDTKFAFDDPSGCPKGVANR